MDEGPVGHPLMGPAKIQDARRPGQAGDERAPAHVHGEKDVDNRNLSPELLRVGQRLGHSVAGELTSGQLGGVLGTARRIRLAIEDHVEGHPHRLLGREIAEGDGGGHTIEHAEDPLLPR